ncbi:MAG: 50S ribosomal protein L3 N(5)-glutamine methyltransferase [Burkholderiaceae bacterium]|nr:MAG: 50S ribosomal protein L3 N(5)-glutamine methyltransferase [Burkholderiaceae bacterium]TAM07722.1 MAG: 50S ribosomal protein L3 N(5)-glutamine methyltransferase [Pusillimonas sp.]
MNPSAHKELFTVRDLLRYTISQFNANKLSFGHGSDNAWDEAVYLLLHALHLPLDMLDPFLDAHVLTSERERVLNLLERRITERAPIAYLTGEAWLQGHRFRVDKRVIVPRSPIAELLTEGLSPWVAEPGDVRSVLDLCTGSGCLAVLAALAYPNARVDAVDLSEDALEVANENIELFDLSGRVSALRSDLFDQMPEREYDVIVCNPPYVNAQAMETLPAEYRHEPPMALAGGPDGMDIVRRVLRDAARFMSPAGILVLEIGNERENFDAAFSNIEPIWLSTEGSDDQILLLTRDQLIP